MGIAPSTHTPICNRRAAGDIATKVRRDLYCHRQLAIAHPAVQFVIASSGALLDKVA
ncbi:hypothetical protein LNP05_05815 [Klebsiella pneumoniae subsp. pneumoniae]|nr:hypothetical protein [Klebsiella pneumoniae subsp. pneumoniae]